jgi:hypothetical protein
VTTNDEPPTTDNSLNLVIVALSRESTREGCDRACQNANQQLLKDSTEVVAQ